VQQQPSEKPREQPREKPREQPKPKQSVPQPQHISAQSAQPRQQPKPKAPVQQKKPVPVKPRINYDQYRGTGMSNKQIDNMLRFMGL